MTTGRNPSQAAAKKLQPEITADEVARYLQQNPEFFDSHPRVLDAMQLTHGAGGTVSLVERQVASLRENDMSLKRKLNELVGLARRNDALASRIHALALGLIESTSLTETLQLIEERLRTSFSADHAVLVLFGDSGRFAEQASMRFLRVHAQGDEALAPFRTFIERGNPRCGQVRDAQRDMLFGKNTDEIGSVALLPLGARAEIGFLAIGSADSEHFHPAMSVDFLKRIGQLIAVALARY
jgi:uncharacterized protein YigA (DUF484 family)